MKDIDVYRDFGHVELSNIEDFEKLLNVKLPSTYKVLLSKHDALVPEKNVFGFKLNNKNESSDISFLGFGEGLKRRKSIRSSQEHDGYSYDQIIVIGHAANGDYICFDYRADTFTDNPPVVVMLHDYPDENNKMLVCRVAEDFEQFIDSLYSDDED